MPDTYPLTTDPVYDALGELFGEISHHTESTRRRVKTQLTGNEQRVELAWNGTPLEEGMIRFINQLYRKGMNLSEEPYRSGTQRAGYWLKQVNGSVTIENFCDGIYAARNVITIPVPTAEPHTLR